MKKGRHYDENEIRTLAKSIIGKTFNEIKNYELITIEDNCIKKGSLGNIIENSLYGIEQNNESEPDFIDAGIELKVTPYKINRDKSLSAKERLVLNMIDFNTEYKNKFRNSHFWFKNNKLEIIWYLFEDNKNKYDLKITNELLYNLELSDDLKEIENDYYTIINKIKDGKAHEISEADTMYLGACSKGSNGNDLRNQPFSDIKAMRRAFCFKTSYMTQLVRKYIGNYDDVEKILNSNITFNEYINNVVNKYKNKTQSELMNELNINSNAKNIFGLLVTKMFGVKGNLRNTDEFLKANIVPRTIRVEENGQIKESMPFRAFKYIDIYNYDWDKSKFKNELETTKYMFFVFKKINGEYVFKGIKLWNMPQDIIDNEIIKVYNNTKDIISNGNIVKEIDNDKRITNFSGMKDNKYCHVRPHARDIYDTYELPVVDKLTNINRYTKHCFWLNSNYLEEILSEFN